MHKILLPLLLAGIAGCHSTNASTADEALRPTLAAPEGAPTPGRWMGYARLASGTRLPVIMDLAQVASKSHGASYRATLRLSLGGFASHEYAGIYFSDVTWTPATGGLAFGGGPDDVKVQDVSYSGGVLRVRLASAKDKAEGAIELRPAPADGAAPAPGVFGGLPDAMQTTGNYVGTCPDNVVSLQIEASRWRSAREADAGLFGGYRMTARLGQTDELTCGKGTTCIKESYGSGDYDILTGALTLSSAHGVRKWELKTDTAATDGCKLVKDPISPHAVLDAPRDYKVFARAEHIVDPVQPPNATPRQVQAAQKPKSGQYYGYLHHENRGLYQLLALNVKVGDAVDAATGKPRPGKIAVGSVATLYFGEGDSSEFVAYRFHDAVWPAGSGQAFVLDGDGEAYLVVDSWNGPVIRGTWYSKTFGRVGTVELQRDLVPGLPADAEVVEKLTGLYKTDAAGGWDFELAVSASVSEDPTDFYPLKVFGWARERIEHARRHNIEEGALDFYTGAVALKLDDGRIAVGRVTPGGMSLHWPPVPRLGTPLGAGETKLFHRQPDGGRASADARGFTFPLAP